jgi:uncharacterized protein DUF5338
MKNLETLLKAKYGAGTKPGKRAQIRNELLLRSQEIVTALGKGWSLRAIWEVLMENDEISCTYKTFAKHVGRLQATAPANAITPKREKRDFRWDSTTPSKEQLI